jgi:hypothetical protein
VRSGSEGIVLPLSGVAMLEVRFRDAERPGESVCLWDPMISFGRATYGFVGQLSSIRLCLPKGSYDLRITSEEHETAVAKGVASVPGRETVVEALVISAERGGTRPGDPAQE